MLFGYTVVEFIQERHDKYLTVYPDLKIVIWFPVNPRSDQLLLSFKKSLWIHTFICIC